MRRVLTLGILVLVTVFATTGYAFEVGDKHDAGLTSVQGGGIEGVGTIQYDPPGMADTFFGMNGAFYGNRFDTAFGQPLSTGSVTALAFYHGGSDATFPYVGVFGPASTTLFAPAISGLVPFTFNTVTVTGVSAVGAGFLAGVLVSSGFSSSADSVGARTATTNGQGFHAECFAGCTGTFSTLNAMVRVSGSVFVPVELQGFEVQ